MRLFIGTVDSVESDYTIRFDLDTFEGNVSPLPRATPATTTMRFPVEGDEVLIVQPNDKLDIFLYFITPFNQDGYLQVEYKTAKITVQEVNEGSPNITLECGTDSSIAMLKDSITVKASNTSIKLDGNNFEITNGSSTISSDGGTVTINKHLKVTG